MKTSNLNIRVNPQIKSEAEALFASLGITVTDAVNIFLHKSIREGGIPFDVKLEYNQTTKKAMQEAKELAKSGNGHKTTKQLFDDLNA